MFYDKRRETVVMRAHPAISDDDKDEDDDVADPDFVPPDHNQDIPGPSDMSEEIYAACSRGGFRTVTATVRTMMSMMIMSSQHHKPRGPANPVSQQPGQPPGTKLTWATHPCLNTNILPLTTFKPLFSTLQGTLMSKSSGISHIKPTYMPLRRTSTPPSPPMRMK